MVLKGTSAAKYYLKTQLRTMGDIDLLVKPADYNRAVQCLLDIGCKDITTKSDIEDGRHRSFSFNDVEIELHHFFSKRVDEEKTTALDELLFSSIPKDSTVLPDAENGLILLSHIAQHLEGGLGLHQIVDWFMFVRARLDDEMWYSSFQENARVAGMETLAITVTRMSRLIWV